MAAYWCAWGGAVAFAFITNKFFVFESKSTSLETVVRELVSFVAARIFSGALNALLLAFLVEIVFCPEMPAKLITSIFTILCNYILSKLFVFRRSKKTANQE